ncbi:ferredoxin-NADP reductase [Azorhizobium caulinodans ORS 571]|uniref:Ferredoxin--NADP reductase n=2 Tax=Xanthobacteraceae TaxID=335928 RepID=A8I287_AZOC5|nr:ferredoxin-NADP reductase [Azorhizobium caulinodans ORS 571]
MKAMLSQCTAVIGCAPDGDRPRAGRLSVRVGFMSNLNEETVKSVHHWTDNLFTFTTTRDPGFRFLNGQFVMIGLMVEGKPLLRAYSLASANYEEDLQFFSIKVQNGPLTSRLQHLKPGDKILVGRKATGTLIQDNLTPGKRLYLLSTGTGLAPFLSVVKDPDAYERFEQIILIHGCRTVAELAYDDFLTKDLPNDEYIGEQVREKLIYYPTVTREPFRNQGRITALIESGKLFTDIGVPVLNPAEDRLMLCGSPQMLKDVVEQLEARGFNEGSQSSPAEYVIEKAFVER